MSRAARFSAVGLLGLLTLMAVLTADSGKDASPTSFGVLSSAYGALYDLLVELNIPVSRNYQRPQELDPQRTVWWIHPPSLCAGEERADVSAWDGAEWVRAGGTAVLFLPPPEQCSGSATLSALEIPKRNGSASHDRPAARSGQVERRREVTGWYEDEEQREQILTGPLSPRPRTLQSAGFTAFRNADGWDVQANLDGAPFIIARGLGSGRLVVVADDRVVSNGVLDRADNALLPVDLVRAFGNPSMDEREHGLRAVEGTLNYLVRSPAVLLLLGFVVLGAVYAWSGRSLPLRRLHDEPAPAPKLASFVDSLAQLYATSRDRGRVWDVYRAFTLSRLRRHFGLAHDVPAERVLERLATRGRAAPKLLAELTQTTQIEDAASLRRAVAELDSLAEEVMR